MSTQDIVSNIPKWNTWTLPDILGPTQCSTPHRSKNSLFNEPGVVLNPNVLQRSEILCVLLTLEHWPCRAMLSCLACSRQTSSGLWKKYRWLQISFQLCLHWILFMIDNLTPLFHQIGPSLYTHTTTAKNSSSCKHNFNLFYNVKIFKYSYIIDLESRVRWLHWIYVSSHLGHFVPRSFRPSVSSYLGQFVPYQKYTYNLFETYQ